MNKLLKIGILSIVCIYMVSRMPVFASDIIWANREPKHRKEMSGNSNGPSSSMSNGPGLSIANSIVQEFNSDGTMTEEYKAELTELARESVINGWLRAPGFGTLIVDNKDTGMTTLVTSLVFDSRTWEHIPNEAEILHQVSYTTAVFQNEDCSKYFDAFYFSVQSWHDGALNDDYNKEFIVYNPDVARHENGQTDIDWVSKYVTIK